MMVVSAILLLFSSVISPDGARYVRQHGLSCNFRTKRNGISQRGTSQPPFRRAPFLFVLNHFTPSTFHTFFSCLPHLSSLRNLICRVFTSRSVSLIFSLFCPSLAPSLEGFNLSHNSSLSRDHWLSLALSFFPVSPVSTNSILAKIFFKTRSLQMLFSLVSHNCLLYTRSTFPTILWGLRGRRPWLSSLCPFLFCVT